MDNEQYTMIVIGHEVFGYIDEAEIQIWNQTGIDDSEADGEPADIETVESTVSLNELIQFYLKNGGKFHSNPDYNPNFEGRQ